MASSLIWTCFLNDNRPAAKPKAKEKKDRLLTWPATDADFTIMWDSAAAVFWSVLFRDLKWLWLTTYSLRPILFPPSRTKRRSKLGRRAKRRAKKRRMQTQRQKPYSMLSVRRTKRMVTKFKKRRIPQTLRRQCHQAKQVMMLRTWWQQGSNFCASKINKYQGM